ncbi:MAG: hypothetical protein B7Y84_10370, partial [Azorhizobium sp. 32-67-21]
MRRRLGRSCFFPRPSRLVHARRPAMRPALLWFRTDLRLHDNPALTHAAETGRP